MTELSSPAAVRQSFAKIKREIPVPDLVEVQTSSYKKFLQLFELPEERTETGLEAAFRSIFPIEDIKGNCIIKYVKYRIGDFECRCGHLKGVEHLRSKCKFCKGELIVAEPMLDEANCGHCGFLNRGVVKRCPSCDAPVDMKIKHGEEECREKGMTYGTPLRVTLRLEVYDKDPATGATSLRDIKEEEVYFGDIPLMSEKGTFIINGTERVIVSQLHRSPGVFFQHDADEGLYVAKIIPYRGSWVEIELDDKKMLHVRVDRKRRFNAVTLLKALGKPASKDIIARFYKIDTISLKEGALRLALPAFTEEIVPAVDVTDPDTGEKLGDAGKKLKRAGLIKLRKSKLKEIEVAPAFFAGAFAAEDIIDTATGEVVLTLNQPVTEEIVAKAHAGGVAVIKVFFPEKDEIGSALSNSLLKDNIRMIEEANVEFYRKMRPGDPPTIEGSADYFHKLFFDPKRYDFSRVGRLRYNQKLGRNASLDDKIMSAEDYYLVLDYLLRLPKNPSGVDDIDHLGNRRIRAVGELLENHVRIGLSRMEKAIKEKMMIMQDIATAMPHDLVNAKPMTSAMNEFFGLGQLSQFMDQTNPLSEVTHRRRLSALGPGGLSRERAGFEVRDVHPSHYGRVCPIETPEGPNIGLITSLSIYARVNEFGFIETPYKKVSHGRIINHVRITFVGNSRFKLNEVVEQKEFEAENRALKADGKLLTTAVDTAFYMTAWQEEKFAIAQANVGVDDNGKITEEKVNSRKGGVAILAERDEVEYVDISPKQLVSLSAALIPFLEHDDANRALMGSNMQRQAVPLMVPESPVVGTGMEAKAARDSGAVVVAKRPGIVDLVDAERIIVRVSGEHKKGEETFDFGADIYPLIKFNRTNQDTCVNQRPLVVPGQRVSRGDILADGPCTQDGELALGRNITVAFMPWRGYNFEDAIILSERLVKDDVFTSIHIEELEVEARELKLGKEEITRDIPHLNENLLGSLDDAGIIKIGAYVKHGDILVGKITPKGETQLSPEEKLLKAIFGEKSAEYRDASLKCPAGMEGTVVNVKIFTRRGEERDARSAEIMEQTTRQMEKDLKDQERILREENRKFLSEMLEGLIIDDDLKNDETGDVVLKAGTKLTAKVLTHLKAEDLSRLPIPRTEREVLREIGVLEERTRRKIEIIQREHAAKIEEMGKGDDLSPGVIKLVKVYVAMKRKIKVGDKMAGRHGNKGVISVVLPESDIPFLPDGTPVDIVLNPLGVPSRMNIGQVLETHLGWAVMALGYKIATPVFDGAREPEIKALLKKAGYSDDGKTDLYDGRTGEKFEQRVTVGNMFMLKLAHMVDDKMHARSIGPYSLITQQPLGGKAQFGGQRFGEMEVWALEAYGAANILQEILTVKSDDVFGRTKTYETIVKGDPHEPPGLPESFNVLVKELQGLGLQVSFLKPDADADDPETAVA